MQTCFFLHFPFAFFCVCVFLPFFSGDFSVYAVYFLTMKNSHFGPNFPLKPNCQFFCHLCFFRSKICIFFCQMNISPAKVKKISVLSNKAGNISHTIFFFPVYLRYLRFVWCFFCVAFFEGMVVSTPWLGLVMQAIPSMSRYWPFQGSRRTQRAAL